MNWNEPFEKLLDNCNPFQSPFEFVHPWFFLYTFFESFFPVNLVAVLTVWISINYVTNLLYANPKSSYASSRIFIFTKGRYTEVWENQYGT